MTINFGDLRKALEKEGQEKCKKCAIEAREMLSKEYERIIGIFYSEYEPQYYKRHIKGGMYKTFTKHYKNSHGSVYSGGIIISSDKMYDDYRGTKENVLGSFLEGYHGPVTVGIKSSITPLDHMLKYRDLLIRNYIN